MPTYDYECANGHRFERFQKMTDPAVGECPDCGAEAQRQISGGAGFLFKGDGFYITDYRSEEYRKKASAEGGESKSESAQTGSSGSAASGGEASGAGASKESAGAKGDAGSGSTPSSD